MIIGVCGFQSSGKDTIAELLIKDHGFQKISFAKAPWHFSRVVKAIVKGKIYKLQYIVKNSKLTRTDLLEIRGIQCNHY